MNNNSVTAISVLSFLTVIGEQLKSWVILMETYVATLLGSHWKFCQSEIVRTEYRCKTNNSTFLGRKILNSKRSF